MQITYAATEAAPASTNEDLFRVGNGWALVLDGAGRYPGESGGCVHPVTWVVARLAGHIEHGLAHGEDKTLTAVMRDAIRGTAADHGPECDLSDPLSPGAAAAVVRTRAERVEWLVLGDCAVVIERYDGQHTVTIDDRVDRLPNAPIVNNEIRTYDPSFIATVRNQPGGFWVAGAVPEAAAHALVGRLPRTDARRALLCSDGVTRLTERYHQTWAEVFALIDTGGPEALIEAVRQAEDADPNPRRWRGKRHDDATAVLFRLAGDLGK